MEKSVGTIVTKIDAVIVKLEAMEKNKAKKREAMSRILETMHKEEGGILLLIILMIIKTITRLDHTTEMMCLTIQYHDIF